MMIISSSMVIVLSLLQRSLAQDFIPRCGDCWCIPDNGTSCPAFEDGIHDSFPASVSETYATFVLTSAPITLQTVNGSSDCYPFADSVGPIPNYPTSENYQCAFPSEGGVCAFKFASNVTSDETCCGREYELVTYSSQAEAEQQGAVVTHKGACGVCSNAHDLSVRMKKTQTLQSSVSLCAISYVLNSDTDRFDQLVDCIRDPESIGFSESCATLWADYAATNAAECRNECQASTSADTELTGSAPQCELLDCLACSNSTFQSDFDRLSGMTDHGSGITKVIPRACGDFFPVLHEPCGGNFTCQATAPSPTSSPPTSNGSSFWKATTMTAAVLVFTIVAKDWM